LRDLDNTCEFLENNLKETLTKQGKTVLSLKAVCAIYKTMVRHEFSVAQDMDIGIIKDLIIDKSNYLCQHSLNSKNAISQYSKTLIRNGMTVLIFGSSSVVQHILKKAAIRGVQFNLIVTESESE